LDGSPLNIIHRDLSPENIFVTYDGAVKVLDFGIAKSDARSREVTEAGVLKGKLAYMAPEQVEAFTADRRTDIFVLGMVMWELITGKRLNSHRSAVDQFRWLTEGKVPSLMTTMNVDPELDAIVQTACQRKPQSRYATAQEMRHALEAFLSRNGGGGAAEHLSRVMVSHFGRVRDSMRVQVRQQIQELDQVPDQLDARDEHEDSPNPPGAITHVVQNSDLLSGDDNYRNATTGRVVVPPRRSWVGWAAASCLTALGLLWFQHARTLGTESIVFRLLPQAAPSAFATSAAAAIDPEPRAALEWAPEADVPGPRDILEPELERRLANEMSSPVVASAPPSNPKPSAIPALAPAETGETRSGATVVVVSTSKRDANSNTPSTRALETMSKVNASTPQTSRHRELPTPQVDELLPSRVPMVN
jgi:hypothetical protein